MRMTTKCLVVVVLLALVVSAFAQTPAPATQVAATMAASSWTMLGGSFNRVEEDRLATFAVTIGNNFYLPEPFAKDSFYWLSGAMAIVPSGVIQEWIISPYGKNVMDVKAYPERGDNHPQYNTRADGAWGNDTRFNARAENAKNALAMREGSFVARRYPNQYGLGYNTVSVWLKVPKASTVNVYFAGFVKIFGSNKEGWVNIVLPYAVEQPPCALIPANVKAIKSWMNGNAMPGRFTDPNGVIFTEQPRMALPSQAERIGQLIDPIHPYDGASDAIPSRGMRNVESRVDAMTAPALPALTNDSFKATPPTVSPSASNIAVPVETGSSFTFKVQNAPSSLYMIYTSADGASWQQASKNLYDLEAMARKGEQVTMTVKNGARLWVRLEFYRQDGDDYVLVQKVQPVLIPVPESGGIVKLTVGGTK